MMRIPVYQLEELFIALQSKLFEKYLSIKLLLKNVTSTNLHFLPLYRGILGSKYVCHFSTK
jgi:hypothetical protein